MAALAGSFDPRFVVLSVRSPIELGSFAYGWFHFRFTPQGSVINAEEAEAGWKHLGSFIDEAVVEQFPFALDYREFDMPHTTTDESIAFMSAWLSGLLDCR